MLQRKLLFAQLGIVVALASLHIVGFIYFLYWRLSWFDVLTHFIAGIWGAFFAAWIFAIRQKKLSLILCIATALALGVAWEIFEVAVGLTQFPSGALDTMKDLSMDVIGGSAGFFLARRFSNS